MTSVTSPSRVAIAEAITRKEEIPFFLDDSFVQYDDNRLAGALEILAALAERHQILLFSCHGREEAIARQARDPISEDRVVMRLVARLKALEVRWGN